MSMVGEYARFTPGELEKALNDPEWAFEYVEELWDTDEEEQGSLDDARIMDVDKAWDGIRYLLAAAGGPPPVDVVDGGVEFGEEDWGYGPPRYLTPDEVRQAAAHLSATPFERLAEHYDPERMRAAQVYPTQSPVLWGDSDKAREYARGHYQNLVAFFAAAAAAGDAVVLWLD